MVRRAVGANQVTRGRQVNRAAIDPQQDHAHVRGVAFVDVAPHAHHMRDRIAVEDRVFFALERVEHDLVAGARIRQPRYIVRRLLPPTACGRKPRKQESQA